MPDTAVLKNKTSPIVHSISGLYGSSFSFWVYYRLQESPRQSHVILTSDKTESQRIINEISALFSSERIADDVPKGSEQAEKTQIPTPQIVYLPAFDNLAYYSEVPLPELVASRIDAFTKICSQDSENQNSEKQQPILLISEVQSLMDKLDLWENPSSLNLVKGEQYPREKLLSDLSELGYQRMSVVEAPKEFSVRGEILDIFPIQSAMPFRISFFDDSIEEIKYFNVETQISQNALKENSLTLFRSCEIVASEENRQKAFDSLREKRSQLSVASYQEALKHLESGIFFSGVEKYRCYFSKKQFSWLDFLVKDWKIFLWQKDKIDLALQNYANEIQEEYLLYKDQETTPPTPKELYYQAEEVQEMLLDFSPLEIYENVETENPTPSFLAQNTIFETVETVSLSLTTQKTLKNKIEELKNLIKKGVKITISAPNLKRAEWIADVLEEFSLVSTICRDFKSYLKTELFVAPFHRSAFQKADKPVENSLTILPYSFQKGFCYQNAGAVYLLIYEDLLFGKKLDYQKSHKISSFKTKISDLKLGDFVVHMDYGIGKYKGIHRQKIAGEEEDFLLIEYKNEDKLYLPVDQITYKIQKFNTAEESHPSLDALGSKQWLLTKKKVEGDIQKIAQELIEIYAQRQLSKSRSFHPPEKELQLFANDFAFVETDDQLIAIKDVWQDLKKERPMDRLICGDAGFGKTEIAMRAAFQVAIEGFQVLLIAPTTILVQQHFETFQKRFKNFPIKIAFLSRFLSAKLAKQTIMDFQDGKIDILIGTHKAFNEKLYIENLGLLIVDEEQRFGVLQKEKLRKFRAKIDLLTLSATPIPRTLNMSLLGIRDISLISTAPQNRKITKTRVLSFNAKLIKEAVKRETARYGQVFILYNQVKTIDKFLIELQRILPEYSIEIAHGQMDKKNLEEVILKFVNKKFQILLTSTIIESGLDLPNANTLIVCDSQKFGLAQLYQLRGRIGRSDKVAFAYFLLPENKTITQKATERLHVLLETQGLEGYRIANRDLELRGVGNLVGTEQSGQVQSVGYDLFMAMIDEAIQKLKESGSPQNNWADIRIYSFIKGFIPDGYINDANVRLYIYQSINQCRNQTKIENYQEELRDRFGRIPEEVNNLFGIVSLKNLAYNYRMEKIQIEQQNIQIHFFLNFDITEENLWKLAKNSKVKLLPDNTISIQPEKKITSLQEAETEITHFYNQNL